MGQSPLSVCSEVMNFDPDCFEDEHPEGHPNNSDAELRQEGPKLALRIAHAAVEASSGFLPSPFGLGDEIAVVKLQKLTGWETLSLRQERQPKRSVGPGWPGSFNAR